MSQPKKKSGGRYKWTLETVNKLKPMVYAEEHISRRAAIKLVQPTTEWERRELEKLRSRANKVIRGENIDILHYTVFDVTTRHPSMKGVMQDFDKNLAALTEAENLPCKPDLKGVELIIHAKEYALNKDKVLGDAYLEPDHMLMVWTGKKFEEIGTCDIAPIDRTEPLYQLTFIKNLPTIHDLPDSGKDGEMYGIMNGNTRDADRYMMWDKTAWVEIQRNPDANVTIQDAVNQQFLKLAHEQIEQDLIDRLTGPKVHESMKAYALLTGVDKVKFVSELPTYGWLKETGTPGELFDIADVEDIGIATVAWDGQDWVDVFDPTRKVPQRRYRAYNDQAPAARKNPVHVLFAASDYAADVLNSRYGPIGSKHGSFEGTTFVKHAGTWVEGRTYDEYMTIMQAELKQPPQLLFVSEEYVRNTPLNELRAGVAYLDKAKDIIAWVNNEWTNLGPVREELGLYVDSEGYVCTRSGKEMLAKKLGCELTFVNFVNSWTHLPDDPKKGDYYMLTTDGLFDEMPTVAWDGSAWVSAIPPHNLITLPVIAVPLPPATGDVIDTVLKNDDRQVDWSFVEPKPNPNSIWARLGRWLGFK